MRGSISRRWGAHETAGSLPRRGEAGARDRHQAAIRGQLGRDQVKDGVARITGELADLAQATVRDAQRLLVNARRALRQARLKAAKLAEAGCAIGRGAPA